MINELITADLCTHIFAPNRYLTLPKLHTQRGQKYMDAQPLHPYVTVEHLFPKPWALICCCNSLLVFHQTLEPGCWDLLPFSRKALPFITIVCRGLGSYPHSCTPNWDDCVLMGLHLCMGKQGRAKHKLKVEVFQTFRFMTRNKEATPTCNSSWNVKFRPFIRF